MRRNNQLREILAKAAELYSPRRKFFQQWLKGHFGFSEIQLIESHLAKLDKESLAYEVGLVAQEYEWCKSASLEQINRCGCQ